MNIFLRELKAYRKSTIIWALSLSILMVVFMLMYPAFTKDVASAKKALENFPLAIRNALGLSLNNFFTIFGFYGYMFTYISLAGAIQAMNIGVGIISKEDSGKTADFLLSKPVTRPRVLTSKLLAALTTIVITNLIYIIASFIMAGAVATTSFSLSVFFLITFTLFLIQLVFLALGTLLSIVIPKIKSVISVSLPVVFVFFFISILGSILGNTTVRYITPFKFYDFNFIIRHGHYEMKYVMIEVIFIVIVTILSYLIYFKKDIRAVS